MSIHIDAREEIKKLSNQIKDELIQWRRHIHMYPELSAQEHKTAKFVAEKLREFGVDEVIENFGGTTAVVGLIKGKHDITVALRADMDALPMQEKTGKPYASKVPNVMHSCGHDAHTTILLGAAKVLTELKEHLQGNVKLIFQPCEERHDCDGAKKLVEAGVLDNPKVSAIFGAHMFPELPAGKVGTKIGHMMASSDIFHIKIKGKGAHASRPHLGVDPVLVGAQVINSLHHIVSRKVDPLHPAVLTIGRIKGGYADNIIPDEIEMGGTVRTLSLELRDQIPKWMEHTIWGVTLAYGAAYEFDYQHGTPPVINDEKTTKFALGMMKDLLGEENVVELENPSMGGEDFAEYLMKVPGTFIRIGIRNEEKGITAPLHSPLFDIDEDVLPIGVSVMAYLAYKWVEEHS
ncbi:M20 family metallopeptidase [Persephonella sp.]|uniref:M20 family metallopeptidase n=1 Tax=Persephonella sp. TaxID=2060922 RepID=UPI0026074F4D|nr:M20 family metallopeptidase [Persephonella sp.]